MWQHRGGSNKYAVLWANFKYLHCYFSYPTFSLNVSVTGLFFFFFLFSKWCISIKEHLFQRLLWLFSPWVSAGSFVTPWTVACQALLYVELSRQEYWRGLPFPSSGDLSDPGIKSTPPACLSWSRQILCQWASREALNIGDHIN